MTIPSKVPGLKWLMIGTAVYAVVWMALEGDLGRVTLLGIAFSLTFTGYGMQRWAGGKQFLLAGWLALSAVGGLAAGLGSGLLTLVFMVLKTGLHGHGPEFRPSEIEAVVTRLPLWSAVGLIAGLGIGVLVWGFRKKN